MQVFSNHRYFGNIVVILFVAVLTFALAWGIIYN